jgi:hypothetical protein
MPEPIQQYYWDACLFLEHLKGESVTADKRRAVIRLLRENKDHNNKIFTSVVTHIEVLPKKINTIDVANEATYWAYFDGIWFIDIDMTKSIVNLAREIKDFYYKEADPKSGEPYRMMSTGDAIHLATAIVWGADELHTRDKNKRGGNIPLIGLAESSPNGKIAGRWSLKIVSPADAQGDLLDPRS